MKKQSQSLDFVDGLLEHMLNTSESALEKPDASTPLSTKLEKMYLPIQGNLCLVCSCTPSPRGSLAYCLHQTLEVPAASDLHTIMHTIDNLPEFLGEEATIEFYTHATGPDGTTCSNTCKLVS